jgi:CDP-glucose 4,6-dehydratase
MDLLHDFSFLEERWRVIDLEDLIIDPEFWRTRRVFVTGHTGFKGSWMSLILGRLGAEVYGFALPPEGDDSLFVAAGAARGIHHTIGDIADLDQLRRAMTFAKPQIAIHLAAQSLVRYSYANPVETYATNVMGTVNLLEAARETPSLRAVVIVTSDKCYENEGWTRGYSEGDALGGHDPYSNSKACAELVAAAYRRSFFHDGRPLAVATARAGNVVGGGDWANDRLVPDAMRAFKIGDVLRIRNPNAVRPWQHVLDPVVGYLRLAEYLFNDGKAFAEAWNFGPAPASHVRVAEIADRLAHLWGQGVRWEPDSGEHPHEANYLALDCTKAQSRLNWSPVLTLEDTLNLTVAWYQSARCAANLRDLTLSQVDSFLQNCLYDGSSKRARAHQLEG